MLLALDINSFALIERLYIEFENGLNIITGETGAGKSIVVDAISFVLGSRFNKGIIKKGADKAEINAVFDLSDKQMEHIKELGFECEDNSVNICRSINTSSKSICRFNGRIITLANLKQISSQLMEIHGQHENQVLFDDANHIDFLDSFIFKDNDSVKVDFNQKFITFKELRNKILDDKMDGKTLNMRLNLIKEQLKEFESVRWKAGEEQQIKERVAAMENAESVSFAIEGSYDLLYGEEGCAFEHIGRAVKLLENISDINESYEKIHKNLISIYYELEDTINELRNEKGDFEFNPQLLEEMQKRLFEFSKLKKKYGNSEEEILEYFAALKSEQEELEYGLVHAGELKEQLKLLYKDAVISARELSESRKKGAEHLEASILKHLNDLGMKNARFEVNMENKDLGSKGIDKVEFLFCANKGQDLKPLTKVASGGEISRLMLAFKNVDLDSSLIDAMVFDEIDTGISGKMAQAVAEKLANIAAQNQVICVTHLPQVAAMGDVNIFVSKIESDNETTINAEKLDNKGKIYEVARLISGSDISESGLMHAEKLVEECKKR